MAEVLLRFGTIEARVVRSEPGTIMNEQERSELERLSQRQSYLQDQVALLGGQIKAFEARLISTRQTNVPPAMEIQPLEIKPAEMPPFASPATR